jgi:hypothetical protein
MVFSEHLRAALPWRLRRTWNEVNPSGSFDLDLTRLEFVAPADGVSQWDFDVEVVLNEAAFELGVPVGDVNGTLSGSGKVGPAGLSVDGRLNLARAEVNGYLVTDLTGQVARPAPGGPLTVEDLVGHFYGGSITGSVQVDQAAAAGEYICNTTLRQVELRDLLNRNVPPGSTPIDVSGVCDAHLFVSGRVGDPRSAQGGGQVQIEHARLFRLPLLLEILDVLGLIAPANGASQTASADFYILGSDVELRDIMLRDRTVAMVGAGRLRRPGYDMDLRLVAVSPHRWFQLPVLTELLEGTARELVEIRARGPLSEPTITAHPLRGVSGAVETLLGQPLDKSAPARN